LIKHTHFVAAVLLIAATILSTAPALYAQQPASPAGPLAPEMFKDIQVLKDLPADQLPITMRYFSAALGGSCSTCHQTDRATGVVNYAADSNGKKTARSMIKLVQTVNAGDFGAKINCGTCHQGHNQPAGLQPATLMTFDQILQTNTQQANAALRAMSPPADRPAGPGAAGPGAGGPGGRGQQPGPPADDVLKKYLDALGPAASSLQSRVMIGTLTTRMAQAMPFSISQKGKMYLETVQSPEPQTIGFDGAAGWSKTGSKVSGLNGFPLDSALLGADMQLATEIKAKYPTLQSNRRTQMTLAPGSTPIDVNILRGTSGQVTEQFYFDATTGLLVRRVTRTATPLSGALTETTDYSDYRAEAGVMTPHKITRNNWNTLDTLTVSRVTLNGSLDDATFQRPK
jgi:hypothetical protein